MSVATVCAYEHTSMHVATHNTMWIVAVESELTGGVGRVLLHSMQPQSNQLLSSLHSVVIIMASIGFVVHPICLLA